MDVVWSPIRVQEMADAGMSRLLRRQAIFPRRLSAPL
jgi:hypothetical protein